MYPDLEKPIESVTRNTNVLSSGRRGFCKTAMLGTVALALPRIGSGETPEPVKPPFGTLMRGLQRDWCEAMLRVQIHDPTKPAVHGALACPACDFIHGRCMDAVYPFLHMAGTTGDERYVGAAIAVMDWSRNVSLENGAWTVVPDPKSWSGITVFGATALAEALHWHGDLLPADVRNRWTDRLRKAADYIHRTFTLEFTNINYGGSAIYALQLLGKLLENEDYQKRARELAGGMARFMTQPNFLLFGEGQPVRKSPRGLQPVDLGYNVEETLNSLALYALEVKDQELIAMVTKSLVGHLEFMLPDGAWDNSWGTRQAKWSYWGSRTTDGCQPAYAAMAHLNPAFGAAAYQNTLLLKACTHDGFLHGGPHYVSRGVKPCVHHTFAHAKSLARLLDEEKLAAGVDPAAALPRAVADGVKDFPEVATWLAARGPWRATVTAYDWLYRKDIYQPTGGSVSMLWHRKVGPVLAGSMAEYVLVEKNNMQPNPDVADHPLTPRIETRENGGWFTNLHDLRADVTQADEQGAIRFSVAASLLARDQSPPPSGPVKCSLGYVLEGGSFAIRGSVDHADPSAVKAAMVVPIVSAADEKIRWISVRKLEIEKPGGTVVIEADAPLRVLKTPRDRIFNMVPGFEAIPLAADFITGMPPSVEIRIKVIS